MKEMMILVFFPLLLIGIIPVFADTYNLKIGEHSFDLEYKQINADVLAMQIDQELNSLLIGIENTQDSEFTINLPNEMISAENSEFAILVDGYEIDYELNLDESMTEISFFVPALSQEIEIIGTHVIPEFPHVLTMLTIMISSMILLTKRFGLFFR